MIWQPQICLLVIKCLLHSDKLEILCASGISDMIYHKCKLRYVFILCIYMYMYNYNDNSIGYGHIWK